MSSDVRWWPVYTGASFDIWDNETGTYFASADSEEIREHLQSKRLSQHRTSSSPFHEFEAEDINSAETLPCHRPRIAFRNVTNPTNTRTVVAALVPGGLILTNAAPYLLRPHGTEKDEAFVLGVLSSMILDWYARCVVELNLNFFLFNDLPVPDPGSGDPVRERVVEIAGRLAATDDRFAEWAAEVGVPVGSANDEPIKSDLIYELDACVALLYGLDEDDLATVYESFSKTVDYSERHAAVLAHFRRWRDDG